MSQENVEIVRAIGQMHAQGANVCHVCAGRVTKLVLYMDSKRALADLELSE